METRVECTRCHRVRNIDGTWILAEMQDRDAVDSDVKIGYGLCPVCATNFYDMLYAASDI